MKLEIELVPSTVWESSLYRLLPKKVWNRIRNEIIIERGRKCQLCGETKGVMNLHEIWSYDDKKHLQKLEGFILLCAMCHHIKHIGLAGILSRQGKLNYDRVIEHFCKVNNCSKKDFEKHKAEAFKIWESRSLHQWTQDFGIYGESINK
jgi:hypothetical protein